MTYPGVSGLTANGGDGIVPFNFNLRMIVKAGLFVTTTTTNDSTGDTSVPKSIRSR
jgi:hypothetical protein